METVCTKEDIFDNKLKETKSEVVSQPAKIWKCAIYFGKKRQVGNKNSFINKSLNCLYIDHPLLLLNYWSRKLALLLLMSDVDNSNIVNDKKGYSFQSTRHRFLLVHEDKRTKKERKEKSNKRKKVKKEKRIWTEKGKPESCNEPTGHVGP